MQTLRLSTRSSSPSSRIPSRTALYLSPRSRWEPPDEASWPNWALNWAAIDLLQVLTLKDLKFEITEGLKLSIWYYLRLKWLTNLIFCYELLKGLNDLRIRYYEKLWRHANSIYLEVSLNYNLDPLDDIKNQCCWVTNSIFKVKLLTNFYKSGTFLKI